MNGWTSFWGGLTRAARAGLVIGALAIVAAVAAGGWALLRTDYGVLFADLSERDMAAMSAELDKQKIPHRIDEATRALQVPHDLVHKARLKLMGAPLALNGAVGFELFNNSDFTMTEFTQKVNYQRALQGELTRTILSLDEVQGARVHLALPEQGLFKRGAGKAKASVALQLKPQRTLSPEQVLGIQRLVAASVNDIQAQDVAVLDQHGVVLSRSGPDEGLSASLGLDHKQGAEAYLTRKATAVIERLLGAGQALVSVDAEFVREQTRVTTEEVLAARAAPDAEGAAPTGVVVRERVSSRDGGAGLQAADKAGGTSTQETEYQVGKRTEQVVSPAGQLKRLHVAVVVRPALDAAQLDKARDLVAAAVGLDRTRGDVIAVHSMAELPAAPRDETVQDEAAWSAPATPQAAAGGGAATANAWRAPSWAGAGVVLVLVLAAAAAVLGGRGRTSRAAQAAATAPAVDREQVLARVQGWLAEDAGAPDAGRP